VANEQKNPNPERVYWDSCTYLDFLQGEEHPLHAQMHMIIEDWRDGKVMIVTSALTIAEVLWVKCGVDGVRTVIDRSRDADIVALFDPPKGQRLRLIELDRAVGKAARQLVWDHGARPKDAIHLASALAGRCPVMHTADTELHKLSGKLGGVPLLKIVPATWVRQMTLESASPPS
jgi:hypothetical protein